MKRGKCPKEPELEQPTPFIANANLFNGIKWIENFIDYY
jgi:hypothetical protein